MKSFLKADQFRSNELRRSLLGDKKFLCGITWSSKIKTIGSFFSGMKDNLKESASFAKQIIKILK